MFTERAWRLSSLDQCHAPLMDSGDVAGVLKDPHEDNTINTTKITKADAKNLHIVNHRRHSCDHQGLLWTGSKSHCSFSSPDLLESFSHAASLQPKALRRFSISLSGKNRSGSDRRLNQRQSSFAERSCCSCA